MTIQPIEWAESWLTVIYYNKECPVPTGILKLIWDFGTEHFCVKTNNRRQCHRWLLTPFFPHNICTVYSSNVLSMPLADRADSLFVSNFIIFVDTVAHRCCLYVSTPHTPFISVHSISPIVTVVLLSLELLSPSLRRH